MYNIILIYNVVNIIVVNA